MIPFIVPNHYYRLHGLPEKQLSADANYYDWLKDLWLYVEPAYAAFYAWARQRCEGEVSDLGCGDGNVGKALDAKYFYDYVQAEEWVKPLDLMSDPIPQLMGDTFILSHVLEHLEKPKHALKNLFDTLRSGNRIIICVPDGGYLESTALPFQQFIPSNDMKAKHIHHLYAWTSADLYNTLVHQGWKGIDVSFANVSGFACLWALAVKP